MSVAIENLLAQAMPGFQRIATDSNLVRWAEESQFALQAFKKNPKLNECAAYTVQDSIINIAAVGLTLNPAFGYAFLVPEYNRNNETLECQLRISAKGLMKISTDSGIIKWVSADVVKKEDTFTYRGKWALPVHEQEPFLDRGESVGVYCVAKMHDGEYIVETAPWSEVLKARAAAKYDGVWAKWEDEMAKKFIIKRASKQWPHTDVTDRLEKAIDVANQTEGSAELMDQLGETAQLMLEALHDEAGPQISVIIEAYEELTDDEKQTLYTAKSKGGWFEHKDRQAIFKQLIPAYYKQKREAEAIEHEGAE